MISFLSCGQAVSAFLACPCSVFVSQASGFRFSCLPEFRFHFSGKHFPLLLFACFPLSLLRQAFSVLFACLKSTFLFQANRFACLYSVFASQASGYCLLCLPVFRFRFSGKRFLSSLLARVPFSLLRQAFSVLFACLKS
ncbi:MAG: hypothetical protein J6Z33_11945, partial [Lachnospiraceae bacterium]|nr:hypothetical protein [Lachnospiraceae bacterium]